MTQIYRLGSRYYNIQYSQHLKAGIWQNMEFILIFGNMDEIFDFHSQNLLPELESCGTRPELIAETFLENSQQLTRIYCR